MAPAQPPLPSPSYLPFQPEVGSQTSILMSESLEGFKVAATRQNSGRFWKAALLPCGSLNPPAGTIWAVVMVVSGRESEARLSQVAAMLGAAVRLSIAVDRTKTACWRAR